MSRCYDIIEPADAANAGAKFLDREQPGWETLIDLNELHMNDCTQCILGQLYGWYDDGLSALNLGAFNGYDAADLGFDTAGSRGATEDYDVLTHQWAKQITRRLDATK